jgi:uncharacterized protein with HEPN domain
MTDDTADRLQHIHDAIIKIVKYAKRGRRRFDREESTQNSIIYYLQIIGEAASAIPLDFRNRHPEIPWRQMISTRNKLIHNYAGIDLDIVWETATTSIPDLELKIKAILLMVRSNSDKIWKMR